MQDFPESSEIFDEIEVTTLCRNFKVTFKVRYGKVAFGRNNEFDASAITTDRVSISKHLPMGGFASNCHLSELKVMENAVIDMAKKHDLMICKKVCSWPFAKAIVQENFYLPE